MDSTQKITPFLWFEKNAEAAVNFYVSLFKNTKTKDLTRYDAPSAEVSGQIEGSVMTVSFELEGQDFIAINGGSHFKMSPAISFFVYCEQAEEVDRLYKALAEGGNVLMPLDQYPYSERYAWVEDQYGLSWQLMLGKSAQKIVPCLLFVDQQFGKAEEAMKIYTGLFENSEILQIERATTGEQQPEGSVKYARFKLGDQEFTAMESAMAHPFTFTGAVSFMVNCQDQVEVDRYWQTLTENGDKQAQQCGWLQDRYGVSWQIIPSILRELLDDPDPEKAQRTTEALLQMKKLDIAALKQAAEKPYSQV